MLSRRRFLALLGIAPAVAASPASPANVALTVPDVAWTMGVDQAADFHDEGNHYIPVSGLNLTPWKVESTP